MITFTLISILVPLVLIIIGCIYANYEYKRGSKRTERLTEREEIDVMETLATSYAMNDEEFTRIVAIWNDKSALIITMKRLKDLLGGKENKMFAQMVISEVQRFHDVKYGTKDIDEGLKPMLTLHTKATV